MKLVYASWMSLIWLTQVLTLYSSLHSLQPFSHPQCQPGASVQWKLFEKIFDNFSRNFAMTFRCQGHKAQPEQRVMIRVTWFPGGSTQSVPSPSCPGVLYFEIKCLCVRVTHACCDLEAGGGWCWTRKEWALATRGASDHIMLTVISRTCGSYPRTPQPSGQWSETRWYRDSDSISDRCVDQDRDI